MGFIELVNTNGMKVTLTDYGARIASILVPCNGEILEMTVTPDDKELLEQDSFYLGATCGPVCNRISNASFSLNGFDYQLSKNDGDNCLHGGENNVSFQYWEVVKQCSEQVTFKLKLAHLQDGFPGNRELYVHYHLSEDNALNIRFNANSDMATPINLTNHAYFNLGEENIQNLMFKLSAEYMLERESDGLPTGQYLKTEETGFSISVWTCINEFIEENKYKQILEEEGVDHCFVLGNHLDAKASLLSVKNGILLSVFTDQPAMQLYTGKFLSKPYQPYQGLCLEGQGFTDSVNHANFPSIIVKEGAGYSQFITYQFSVQYG